MRSPSTSSKVFLYTYINVLCCYLYTCIYVCDLIVEFCRGSLLRQERLQSGEAPGDRGAESTGNKADAELQVQGVRARDLCLDALLLVSDQRRHRVPQDLPQPSLRDCPSNSEEAGPACWSALWWPIWRSPPVNSCSLWWIGY